MVDHKLYVPILRWKQAEWLALGNLRAEDKARLTPLVEITPRSVAPRIRRPTVDQMLEKNAADIESTWGYAPIFVDLWLLNAGIRATSGLHPLLFLAERARARNLRLIPVTGVGRNAEYQSAVLSMIETDGEGACIRLLRQDLENPMLPRNLMRTVSSLGVGQSQVDIIVDFQVVDSTLPSYSRAWTRLPNISDWRSLTLAGGAFPRDLQGLKLGRNLLPRLDWRAWKRAKSLVEPPLQPSFGDYTIQFGAYVEPPERANFSASIRYTAEDDWLVMRGEGVFHDGSPGFPQWPANAQLLCDSPEFCGADFSRGDMYIRQMGRQDQKTGSAGTWLQAGINHHLTFVVRQVASLFGT